MTGYLRRHASDGGTPDGLPHPGDVVLLTGAASTQFGSTRAITFRVTKVDHRPTYHGWIWLSGYQLDRHGKAVWQRNVFVQVTGIIRTGPAGQPFATGRTADDR